MLAREMSGMQACCIHACTVYTPIGDKGCLEGKPAVSTLTQCTPLLEMMDIWKAGLLYIHLYSVHPYCDEGYLEGKPAVICLNSVHPFWG